MKRTPNCMRAVAQGLDQKLEGGRGLSPARIIEVIADEARHPVLEHALEAPGGNMRRREILGDAGEAVAVERRRQDLRARIEGEPAVDADIELPPSRSNSSPKKVGRGICVMPFGPPVSSNQLRSTMRMISPKASVTMAR